jgi:hypothetical protein
VKKMILTVRWKRYRRSRRAASRSVATPVPLSFAPGARSVGSPPTSSIVSRCAVSRTSDEVDPGRVRIRFLPLGPVEYGSSSRRAPENPQVSACCRTKSKPFAFEAPLNMEVVKRVWIV